MSATGNRELAEKPKDIVCEFQGALQDCTKDQPFRSALEIRAQNHLDHLNLADKAALSPEQSDTLRNLETAFLRGDLKSVETTLQKYKGNPDAAKPFMDVLTKELSDAGIYAIYGVDPVLGVDGNTGGLILDSAKTLAESRRADHKTLYLYTNPALPTTAELYRPKDIDAPPMVDPDLAFKEITAQVRSNLAKSPGSN